MRINTNISSLTAQEASVNVNKGLGSSLEKLSTGLRINKASDDASGMAIADKLRTQASGVEQGISNANSANTFVQIADKAMGEQSNILDIVKTKLMQASTSTTSSDGRAAILNDIKALLTQFDSISTSTNYNGTTLLDGSDFTFQIGEKTTDIVKVSTSRAATTTSISSTGASLANLKSTMGNASFKGSVALNLMSAVDKALTNLNTVRSEFGSAQNQVESALRNMMTTHTNLKAGIYY
jgi:flagellin